MTITNLVQGKKDKERVNVFVDGEFAFALDKRTLVNAKLYKGKELSATEANELVQQDSLNYIYRRLLQWCYKKPRYRKEVIAKIHELTSKKEFPNSLDAVELEAEILNRLAAKGVNDSAYAEWYVQERIRQGKYGPHFVRAELQAKGVPADTVNNALHQYQAVVDQSIVNLLNKKYGVGSLAEIPDTKLRWEAKQWLYSKGFGS